MSEHLREKIRDVPDFPTPGIIFKDITTLLKDGPAFKEVIDTLVEKYRQREIDAVVAIESRGYIFGAPLAAALGTGLIPVRKMGKLPVETVSATYELEYGTETVEMHRDAILPGQKVLIVDDLLATGGTASAAKSLVEELGGRVEGFAFLIELTFLNGREKLKGYDVFTIIAY